MFSKKKAKEIELNILQEAIRILKSNILFCDKENKIKTITITSCNSGEGKTTIAFNLALSLAYSGIKTLLIDAEFKKQKNHWLLEDEVNQTAPRMDLNSVYPDEIIKETRVRNLNYLSIGSSLQNPEMLIDSDQLKSFLSTLSKGFGAVIIDAPSLNGVIDSAIISANTDAVLLVIQSKLHDYRTVLHMKEQLEKASARLLGVVLCKAENSSLKAYFSYQRRNKSEKQKEILELIK